MEKGRKHKSKETVGAVFGWDLVAYIVWEGGELFLFFIGLCLNCSVSHKEVLDG